MPYSTPDLLMYLVTLGIIGGICSFATEWVYQKFGEPKGKKFVFE